MTVDPGWYYAEGDPPGTVRRWNGTEWIGFPVAPPNEDGSSSATVGVGVKPFEYPRGMISLKVPAVLTQLSLICIILSSIVFGVTLLQVAPHVEDLSRGADLADAVPDGVLGRFVVSGLITTLLKVVTGIVFVVWFFIAYRNTAIWARPRRGPSATIWAWFVPFMNLLRPASMMLELAENSPRPDRRQDMNPIPIVVWWVLWLATEGGMLFFRASGGAEEVGSSVITFSGFVTLLSAVTAGMAIWVVQKITDAQEGRRTPSPAQRELMARDAEVAAFHNAQSSGIVIG